MNTAKIIFLTVAMFFQLYLFAQTEAIDCQNRMNYYFETILKKEIINYDANKNNIDLVCRMHLNKCGKLDSIEFIRNNIENFGANNETFVKILKKKRFKCFYKIFYKKNEAPDGIIYMFAPPPPLARVKPNTKDSWCEHLARTNIDKHGSE